MGETVDDAALLMRMAAGDEAALAALYAQYAPAATRAACRLLGDAGAAEEVVQDAFMRAWLRAGTFDPARGSAGTWLRALVRHAAIDRGRGRWAHSRDREVALTGARCATIGPDLWAEAAECEGIVRAALAALPPTERAVAERCYLGELTCAEAAAKVGVPLGTAKARLRRAQGRLRVVLAPLRAA